MTKVKVTNPTDSDIYCQYKGVMAEIPARSSIELDADFATYWHDSVHGFIQVGEIGAAPAKVVIEKAPEAEAPAEAEVEKPKVAKKK